MWSVLLVRTFWWFHHITAGKSRVRKGDTRAAHTQNMDVSFLNATSNSLHYTAYIWQGCLNQRGTSENTAALCMLALADALQFTFWWRSPECGSSNWCSVDFSVILHSGFVGILKIQQVSMELTSELNEPQGGLSYNFGADAIGKHVSTYLSFGSAQFPCSLPFMFAGAVPSVTVRSWSGSSSPVPSVGCPQLKPLPVGRLSRDSSVWNLPFPLWQAGPLGCLSSLQLSDQYFSKELELSTFRSQWSTWFCS